MKIVRASKKEVCNFHEQQEGSISYITFPKLEEIGNVSHLFTTREGGVSEGEFSSLNLSYTRGDDAECVEKNYRRVAKALGCEISDIVCSDQTHTVNVKRVISQDKGKGVVRQKDYTDIDGLITNEPGIALATFYADCVPLYIVDIKNHAIGLSHSGWRGTVQKMGEVTLQAMNQAYSTEPKDVRVAIGPSICQSCYEVSEDVANEFMAAFPNAEQYEREYHNYLAQKEESEQIEHRSCLCYRKENGKYQLNLWFANYVVFREAGVAQEQIEITDVCTCCNSQLLFSHRASHGRRGNLGAFLMIKSK